MDESTFARASPSSSWPAWRGPGRVLAGAVFYAHLLQLAVMSLAYNLGALLAGPFLRGPRGAAAARAGIARAYRWFWACARASGLLRIDARPLDALRDEPGGLLIAANHPTMLDALIVVSRLPRGVCVMKAGLMRNPFLGAGARLARYICNDSPRGLVRQAVQCLREGGQLVMFPEGTRTVRAPLNALRPGFTLIAARAGVPIQTLILETDSPFLAKGWPIWRLPPLPIVIHARLGARFAPERDHSAMLERLERYFATELARDPAQQTAGGRIGA
jgi:1-acyl-sn-glycerol-3-phosphate acyltransferase